MENMNHKYWTEMTVKSTLSYCKEMLRLSSNPYEKVSEEDFDQQCEAYVRKLIEYDKGKTLKDHIDELYELSPFPDDIRGYLHEYSRDRIFQPKHLMCKITTIRVVDITFEFLVEYGILESDVEIYYGIKAISDDIKTTEHFAKAVMELSDKWFEYIRSKNKNRGKIPIDYRQHKFTNNVHDGTFWISWVRMESKDKFDIIVNSLSKRIFPNFETFLSKEAGGQWGNIDKVTASIDKIRDILNNKPMITTKHSDLIKVVEAACEYKDRNSEDGKTILERRGNNRYRFTCDLSRAMIFLEMLFNPEHFTNTYNLADEFWGTPTLQNTHHNLRDYINNTVGNKKKHWYSNDKRDFDRKWIQDTFSANDGSPLLDNFFNSRPQFDKATGFYKIKATLTEFG